MIIRSGFNVYPAEVEAVLNSHQAVVQSAVVGRAIGGNEKSSPLCKLLKSDGHHVVGVDELRWWTAHLIQTSIPDHRP